jgi:hypothetical protein
MGMNGTTEKVRGAIAKELERVTIFSAKATASIAEQFKNLSESDLRRLLPTIQDYAATYSVDLWGASLQIQELIREKGFDGAISDISNGLGGFAVAEGKTSYGALRRLSSALRELGEEVLHILHLR